MSYADYMKAIRSPSTLDEMIRSGADLDAWDEHGDTALTLACWQGNEKAVRRLLEAGADAERPTEMGQAPADVARGEGFEEIAAMVDRWILEIAALEGTEAGEVVDLPSAPPARKRL